MPKGFAADVAAFRKLTARKMQRVVRDSVQDLMEAAQDTALGVTRGGTIIQGRMPVGLTSNLVNSLFSEIVGGNADLGETSYVTTVAKYEVGDTMRFAWGMEYAMRIEMGFVGKDKLGREYNQPGWQFVSYNAARWTDIVAANVRIASA